MPLIKLMGRYALLFGIFATVVVVGPAHAQTTYPDTRVSDVDQARQGFGCEGGLTRPQR